MWRQERHLERHLASFISSIRIVAKPHLLSLHSATMLAAHGALSIVSHPFAVDGASSPSISASMTSCWFLKPGRRRPFFSRISRIVILGSQSGSSSNRSVSQEEFVLEDSKAGNGDARQVRV